MLICFFFLHKFLLFQLTSFNPLWKFSKFFHLVVKKVNGNAMFAVK